MRRKITVGATATIAGLSLQACGTTQHQNKLRPPAAIILSAAITPSGISVSPSNVGAGPVTIVVTNQTDSSRQLTFETADSGAGVRQQTAPINPQDAATLKADVNPGAYTLRVSGSAVKAAKVTFGTRRPSAQNELDLP